MIARTEPRPKHLSTRVLHATFIAMLPAIRRLAQDDPDVLRADRPLTMHLGPHEVLLNLDIQFRPGLSTRAISAAVDRLEKSIRSNHPDVKRIFIEAERLLPTELQDSGEEPDKSSDDQL